MIIVYNTQTYIFSYLDLYWFAEIDESDNPYSTGRSISCSPGLIGTYRIMKSTPGISRVFAKVLNVVIAWHFLCKRYRIERSHSDQTWLRICTFHTANRILHFLRVVFLLGRIKTKCDHISIPRSSFAVNISNNLPSPLVYWMSQLIRVFSDCFVH